MPTDNPDFTETRLTGETAFTGSIIRVEADQVRLPNGHIAGREVVRHPGAVAILPLLDQQTILLEWQYRYPLGQHIWEIPAGKLDAGEAPLVAAQRELLEETGYSADRWEAVLTMATCAGFGDERITLFLAQDLIYRGRALQAGEFLQLKTVSLTTAMAMIQDGQIIDAKTLIALLWFVRRAHEEEII